MNNLIEQIINYISNNPLEIFAVLFGLLSVWYAKKEHILVFPTGIVSVIIYVYICFHYKLYADMVINTYYLYMSIYGWFIWSRIDNQNNTIKISRLSNKEVIFNLCLFLLFIFLLLFLLSNFTDSDVVFIDSLTTSLFFVAMYLMAKKKIENWILWIFADIISIPLYIYKGLLFSGFQFFVFTIIAILGYIEWKKTMVNFDN